MPFYFEDLFLPATFWRNLETYTPVVGDIAEGGGLGGAWRPVLDVAGRGILLMIGDEVATLGMRYSIDGGAFVLYPGIEAGSPMMVLIGFANTLDVDVWRSNAFGCHGWATAIVE